MSIRHRTILAIVVVALVIPPSLCPASSPEDAKGRAAGDGDWSAEVTVTSGSGMMSPSIVLANDTLHVAFLDDGVRYSRGRDGGATWSDAILLGPSGQDTPYSPSVAADGELVVVVWSAMKSSTTRALYWARSMDGGATFEGSAQLAGTDNEEAYQPRAVVKGDWIYVLWADTRDDPTGEHELMFRKSEDGGDTWKAEKRVTNAARDSFNHDFEVVGSTIHIVWEDERDGPHWTYYKKSTDGGDTFGAAAQICQGIEASEPDLAVEGTKVHVTWWRPTYDIYYRRSDDGGSSWGTPSTLVSTTDETRHEAVIEAHGDHLEVVYNQNGKLYYMNSTDGGGTWGTGSLVGDGLPSINFEGYWAPMLTTDVGTFLTFSNDSAGIRFRYKGLHPDLSIGQDDISFDDPYREGNDTMVNVTATVHNTGATGAWGAEVSFYEGSVEPGNLIGTEELGPLGVGGDTQAVALWAPPSKTSVVIVKVMGRGPMELDVGNNEAQTMADIANFFPVPALEADRVSALTLEDIAFDAVSSWDQDGVIDSYWFDFGDGNSTGWVSDEVVAYAYADDGNYMAALKVKDNLGAESGWAYLEVGIQNREPMPFIEVRQAGPYETGQTLDMDGYLSEDKDGDVVSFLWDLGDGTTSTEKTFQHVYWDDGAHTISLTVTDDDGAANSTEVEISIDNRRPEAAIAVNVSTTFKGGGVEFDASASSDPDGTIASYEWDFGDGRTGEGVVAEHDFKKAGTFNVTLTVTDDDGATDEAFVEISVTDQAPVAVANADVTEVLTLEFVSFSSSGSHDLDGRIVARHWDFGDGTVSEAADTKHSFQRAGTYEVVLTVTDDAGQNDTANISITVLNRLPMAEIRADAQVVDEGGTVNLTAMFSSDEDGFLVEFVWDLGDGGTDSGMNVTHRYTKADNYTVVLKVVDNDGGEAMASTVITVRVPYVPPPPPDGDDDGEDGGWVLMLAGGGVAVVVVVIVVLLLVLRGRRRRRQMTLDLGDLGQEQQGGPEGPEQGGGYEGGGYHGEAYQEGYQQEGQGGVYQEEGHPPEGHGGGYQEGYQQQQEEEEGGYQ